MEVNKICVINALQRVSELEKENERLRSYTSLSIVSKSVDNIQWNMKK